MSRCDARKWADESHGRCWLKYLLCTASNTTGGALAMPAATSAAAVATAAAGRSAVQRSGGPAARVLAGAALLVDGARLADQGLDIAGGEGCSRCALSAARPE